MMMAVIKRSLCTLLLLFQAGITSSKLSSTFVRDETFGNRLCPTEKTQFVQNGLDIFQCLMTCKKDICTSVFFNNNANVCYGCHSYDANQDGFIETSGTTYWKLPLEYLVWGKNGVRNSTIQLTASSSFTNGRSYAPYKARLNATETYIGSGAWSAGTNDDTQYIQVDFIEPKIIHAIAIQGRPATHVIQRVTAYRVMYSLSCTTFDIVLGVDGEAVVFNGNNDAETVVINRLPEDINARCIQINPTAWQEHISLRFDVLGFH